MHTDYFWKRQQQIVENFTDLVEGDNITEADKVVTDMEDDKEMHPSTYFECRKIYDEFVNEATKFHNDEHLTNQVYKHE